MVTEDGCKEREMEFIKFGGYLPIVSAAIKHRETGAITLGGDHYDAMIHAFRIESGSKSSVGRLLNEEGGIFDLFLQNNKFISGFVNSNMWFMDRPTSTQLVGITRQLRADVTELHAKDIMSVPEPEEKKTTDEEI